MGVWRGSFASLQNLSGFPEINLDEYEIAPAVAQLVPREVCEQWAVVPIALSGRVIVLAMADPFNALAKETVTLVTGRGVEPVVATEEAIRQAIRRTYAKE